ncbi:Fur family transcriptional regulator [Desulfovibrio sp. JC010]|uniref:Fur family transcriptional regulator n=1 Tax=Desulfovibrio sp. JC010 TaxID=2593641 RepID=UPI0013D2968D|nr:transcriptional repressor [Desulfovibrio sp. JC010]NDV26091.1 transcriptional repressor [Desulfovibrio sp. JC010]
MSSPQTTFLEYLNKNNMAATEQRRVVLEVFLGTEGHHSCEELYAHVSKRDPSISPATVYRTIKLLAESGIAEALDFGDGVTRFECRHNRHHHDHLVCIRCNRRIEVMEDRIEDLQEKLARKHGFTVNRHKMVLYGICPDCRKQ